ncbi:MAG: hypothetical protein HOM51_15480 [Rhodospirillaceae bacterium]|nr:hypothetical protein [Rhodospirillaceae bacterium]
MSLDQLAQSAAQAFSQIIRAETGLLNLQHGEVARAALVECYKFGKQAKKAPTDFQTICTDRNLIREDFSWTVAVRCVYGAFVPKGKGSNETVWEASKSSPVISKYARVLEYAERNEWNEQTLSDELDSLGIERLVVLARSNTDAESVNGKPKISLFSKAEIARINSRHFVSVEEFDLPEEAFCDGFASVLLRKEDDGYSVWVGNADEGIIKNVASPFTKQESIRDHLKNIVDLAKFSSDDTLYVNNTTNGVQITFAEANGSAPPCSSETIFRDFRMDINFPLLLPMFSKSVTSFYSFSRNDLADKWWNSRSFRHYRRPDTHRIANERHRVLFAKFMLTV